MEKLFPICFWNDSVKHHQTTSELFDKLEIFSKKNHLRFPLETFCLLFKLFSTFNLSDFVKHFALEQENPFIKCYRRQTHFERTFREFTIWTWSS